MNGTVSVFVLLKSAHGPFCLKGSFNRWSSPVELTQLGHGCCWLALLERRPFAYKYYSTRKAESRPNRFYDGEHSIIVDHRFACTTDFSACELLIALADVLLNGIQYINDPAFLCRAVKLIFKTIINEVFVSDSSSQELYDGIQYAIRVLTYYKQLPLLIDCLARFTCLRNNVSKESLALIFKHPQFWSNPKSFLISHHVLRHHSDPSFLFPVFSVLSDNSSLYPNFRSLSQHEHLLSQSLRSFKDQSLPCFLRLASSPFPKELSHQLCTQLIDVLPFDEKFRPETVVAKISSTALFRHFYTSYVNNVPPSDHEQVVVDGNEEGENVPEEEPEEDDIVEEDHEASSEEDQDDNVPAGLDPVSAATTISQQILQFIFQLLEPDVKASHLESIYSSFNEEEMSNEMEIISLIDSSGKLQKDVLFNIKSWVNRHVWDPIIACFQNVSGLFSSIKVSASNSDKEIPSVEELSSESLLSDFGSYSKKFSSMVDCSHCNRTSPPLYLQIFQLLNNADDLLSILNKYSTLTPEELSSKLYGNFAASYTVNSSVAQFFISMLDDPKSLWNSVLKPVFDAVHFDDEIVNVDILQLLDTLHTWMNENCHSPQRVAADCKSINQLKSAIKAIDELLGSDGDQSALINIISKCNFQKERFFLILKPLLSVCNFLLEKALK
ncbi:hypothetical protein GEMRC1_002836 [Eukaryota sp. GEM-RC1]